jgi:hypothetical protein
MLLGRTKAIPSAILKRLCCVTVWRVVVVGLMELRRGAKSAMMQHRARTAIYAVAGTGIDTSPSFAHPPGCKHV